MNNEEYPPCIHAGDLGTCHRPDCSSGTSKSGNQHVICILNVGEPCDYWEEEQGNSV